MTPLRVTAEDRAKAREFFGCGPDHRTDPISPYGWHSPACSAWDHPEADGEQTGCEALAAFRASARAEWAEEERERIRRGINERAAMVRFAIGSDMEAGRRYGIDEALACIDQKEPQIAKSASLRGSK